MYRFCLTTMVALSVLFSSCELLAQKLKIVVEEGESQTLIIHPAGEIEITQKTIPLEIEIEKAGNSSVSKKIKIFVRPVDSLKLHHNEKESFKPSHFIDLSNSDKLSNPEFENLESGIQINEDRSDTRCNAKYKVTFIINHKLKKAFSVNFNPDCTNIKMFFKFCRS